MGNQTIGRRSQLARRIGPDGTPWPAPPGLRAAGPSALPDSAHLVGRVGRPAAQWKVPARTWLESSFIHDTIVALRRSSIV
jgi:hypothetical protein